MAQTCPGGFWRGPFVLDPTATRPGSKFCVGLDRSPQQLGWEDANQYCRDQSFNISDFIINGEQRWGHLLELREERFTDLFYQTL